MIKHIKGLAFIAALVFGLHTSAADKGIGPSFKGPVGLQLYSLRADFARNVPLTLEKVKNMGFKYVELAGSYNMPADQFRQLLDKNGLEPVSGHFPFDRLRDDMENVAKEAKTLGLKYAGCAWIPHEGEFDEKECLEAIRVFNNAGAVLAKQGIKFFYHAHGYEFRKHGDGQFMDLLMKETKPEHVSFEMDTFWIVYPGEDPVKWLAKYPSRWELMHLKDMKKSLTTREHTGKADVSNDVALGVGQLDWPAILKEAKRVGVKWYFVEDEAPTAAEQIPVTLNYLEKVQF